ncbi:MULTISPECIES: DUF2795 domain-containing protein [unclassified Calothrix]|uniref:DUF2795 domain-containing protein n=1 Tax=unclassified Calothrix TaxID=2619626 RepID=UPI001F554652|nr:MULTISPECIES: DUF2795 domain-containing protein [unclassified Calothrix]
MMSTATSVQLNKNLHELNYPISKKDLIKNAEEKGFDEKVLRILKKIPYQDYENSTDVSEAIANLK